MRIMACNRVRLVRNDCRSTCIDSGDVNIMRLLLNCVRHCTLIRKVHFHTREYAFKNHIQSEFLVEPDSVYYYSLQMVIIKISRLCRTLTLSDLFPCLRSSPCSCATRTFEYVDSALEKRPASSSQCNHNHNPITCELCGYWT